MKIGMPTIIQLETLEENVSLCKDLGLDFVEINMNFPQYQLDKLRVDVLNKLQEKYDIFFTFHVAEDIDIGHLNGGIRKVYIDEILQTISLMEKVNSNILNMHMSRGLYVTLPTEKIYVYDKYKANYIDNVNEFIHKVSSHIGKNGVRVYIENTGIGDIEYVRTAIEKMLTCDCFRLTWDIGHNYSNGNKDESYLLSNYHSINHYHIHDAIGSSNHLVLYSGELHIDDFFRKADESNSTVVIETKTIEALRESVYRMRNR